MGRSLRLRRISLFQRRDSTGTLLTPAQVLVPGSGIPWNAAALSGHELHQGIVSARDALTPPPPVLPARPVPGWASRSTRSRGSLLALPGTRTSGALPESPGPARGPAPRAWRLCFPPRSRVQPVPHLAGPRSGRAVHRPCPCGNPGILRVGKLHREAIPIRTIAFRQIAIRTVVLMNAHTSGFGSDPVVRTRTLVHRPRAPAARREQGPARRPRPGSLPPDRFT